MKEDILAIAPPKDKLKMNSNDMNEKNSKVYNKNDYDDNSDDNSDNEYSKN